MIFTSVNLYEAVARAAYPFRFTTDPDATEATRTAAIERMAQGLTVLEDAIGSGPFLLGGSMSVVDLYIAMQFIWFKGEIDAPRLTALTDGVKQHPTVAPIWRRHFGAR